MDFVFCLVQKVPRTFKNKPTQQGNGFITWWYSETLSCISILTMICLKSHNKMEPFIQLSSVNFESLWDKQENAKTFSWSHLEVCSWYISFCSGWTCGVLLYGNHHLSWKKQSKCNKLHVYWYFRTKLIRRSRLHKPFTWYLPVFHNSRRFQRNNFLNCSKDVVRVTTGHRLVSCLLMKPEKGENNLHPCWVLSSSLHWPMGLNT